MNSLPSLTARGRARSALGPAPWAELTRLLVLLAGIVCVWLAVAAVVVRLEGLWVSLAQFTLVMLGGFVFGVNATNEWATRASENEVAAGAYLAEEFREEPDIYSEDTPARYERLKARHVFRTHLKFALWLISDREGHYAFRCHKARLDWDLSRYMAKSPSNLSAEGHLDEGGYRRTVRGWDYCGASASLNRGRQTALHRGVAVWDDLSLPPPQPMYEAGV